MTDPTNRRSLRLPRSPNLAVDVRPGEQSMYRLFKLLLVCCLMGCASTQVRPFVQDNLVVTPPVAIGSPAFALDGGTAAFIITDATGKRFAAYIDHRCGEPQYDGQVWLNGYPGETNSIMITDRKGFIKRILNGHIPHKR